MKYFSLLFASLLLLIAFSTQAKPLENTVSCPLAPPAWINSTNITANSISIEWQADGSVEWYKITRFDLTNGVQLPDVIVPGSTNTYTSSPHAPGESIQFGLRATACTDPVEDDFGDEASAIFTTTFIIVDVIASFSAPGVPTGDYQIWPSGPSGAGDINLNLLNAGQYDPTVRVNKIKVYAVENGTTYFAEFLAWSHCSTVESSASRIMYWKKTNWPSGVTCTPASGASTTTVVFKVNGKAFFTLNGPSFTGNTAQIKIRNDRSTVIYYSKLECQEDNPCYEPEFSGPGGQNTKDNIRTEEGLELEDRADIKVANLSTALHVTPNPFSTSFSLQYTLETESPVTLSLYDHTGRALRVMQLPDLQTGEHTTSIYTNDLPAGIYQLGFQSNKQHSMTTLVKHH